MTRNEHDVTAYSRRQPYASAVVASGRLAFLSGHAALNMSTGEVQSADFESQVRLTLDNLAMAAAQAGGSLARAVKVNAYLRDMADWPEWNRLYAEYFGPSRPARTTVQSNLIGWDIEVDAIIALD